MDAPVILGCSFHLSGWSLPIALVVVIAWVLAPLLSLFNIGMVVTTPASDKFKFTHFGIALSYLVWGIVLFFVVSQNIAFIVLSACLIPVLVFSHTGYLVSADRKIRRERILNQPNDT